MGQIRIELSGSFGAHAHTFCAREYGHADAVARAIEYLSATVMPKSTAQDHALAAKSERPSSGGFDRSSKTGTVEGPCWKCGGDGMYCNACGEREAACECENADLWMTDCDICAAERTK